MLSTDRFIRLPTALLECQLQTPLNGAQWRILFWVIRQTYGWNRESTPFTWYRMAQELGMNRPAVYRAGQALLTAGILVAPEKQLAVQTDHRLWNSCPTTVAGRQLWMPEISVAGEQRPALLGDNATVASRQRKRCQKATVFRRAKDSKDRLKTYKDNSERRHLAGAAKPIPGKYDGLSQN